MARRAVLAEAARALLSTSRRCVRCAPRRTIPRVSRETSAPAIPRHRPDSPTGAPSDFFASPPRDREPRPGTRTGSTRGRWSLGPLRATRPSDSHRARVSSRDASPGGRSAASPPRPPRPPPRRPAMVPAMVPARMAPARRRYARTTGGRRAFLAGRCAKGRAGRLARAPTRGAWGFGGREPPVRGSRGGEERSSELSETRG